MDDPVIEARLDELRVGDDGDPYAGHMDAAWLLVALGRHDEAFEVGERAQERWQANRRKNPSPYGGSFFWDPWRLQAAVHLGTGDWAQAARCAGRVLSDFSEDDRSFQLYMLALHRQGKLRPDLVTRIDPSVELAASDLRAYALRQAGFRPGEIE